MNQGSGSQIHVCVSERGIRSFIIVVLVFHFVSSLAAGGLRDVMVSMEGGRRAQNLLVCQDVARV